MKTGIASDHAGYRLKTLILQSIEGQEFIDYGTDSEESCDYPDCIGKAGEAFQKGEVDRAIVICGSGIGASLVANKFHGVRAALCFNGYMAEMSRRHNNSNMLALGARVVGDDVALDMVRIWLSTPFDGGRHQRRIDKISAIEENQCSAGQA